MQKALELPNNGFFVYNLNGANYNGNDLPVGVYSYGSACIYKRNSESIFVFLTGIAASSTPLATNWYDGASWTGWKTYVTNTDLTERFKPIRIFGTEGGTFSKTLKNKVYNSVVFLAFDASVPDNPFSFEAGYAIAFHAGLLKAENVFTLIGFDSNALHPLEIKMLDLRS